MLRRPSPLAARTLALRSYEFLSELALPLFAAAAYWRGGLSAVKHTLMLGTSMPPARDGRQYVLWVHGASIGETLSALPLVRRLLKRSANAHVVMTASTPSALERLSMEGLGPRVHLQQRPADAGSAMRRFLRHWRPSSLVIVESELWPNLLLQTRAMGVPIGLVNGRMSARSLDRWQAFAPHALRQLLTCCSVALAQSPKMAQRLQQTLQHPWPAADATPAPPAAADLNVVYRGDLKQIARHREAGARAAAERTELRARLQSEIVRPGRTVWLAASTHAEEEEAVLSAHAALRCGAHPDLLLLLVPRHIERGPQLRGAAERALAAGRAVEAVEEHTGRRPARSGSTTGGEAGDGSPSPLPPGGRLATSDRAEPLVALRSAGEVVSDSTSVYVCDTLGELPELYSLAGVAFVGGSLTPLGGHSLLEAAQAEGGCAVLHGPHIEAVEAAAGALAGSDPPAAQLVTDAEELSHALHRLLSDAPALEASRRAASRVAAELEGGVLEAVWQELAGPLGLPAAETADE